MLKVEVFASGEQQIDEDNARQRARFLARVRCMTSTDLQRLARHRGGRVRGRARESAAA